MKKINLYIATAILAVGFTSCSNDNWKDEVNSLKQPLPSGIILLSTPTEMVKGDTVPIVFRVNPSSASLALDTFQLDCIRNEIYELETEDNAPTTRASYVASPANYKLTAVKTVVNDNNEVLDGEYIAYFTAATDANIFDVSTLCLIIKGRDMQGKERLISSEPFDITMVPTIEEGVTVWYAKNHSYNSISRDSLIIPSYVSVDEHTYVLKGTQYIKVYSLDKYLKSATYIPETLPEITPEEKPGGLFLVRDSLCEKGFLELYPAADTKWETFEETPNGKIEINGRVELTDRFGTKCVRNVNVNYFNNAKEVIPFDIPLASIEPGKEYVFNISDLLKQLGWDKDEIETYRREIKSYAPISQEASDFFCEYNPESQDLEITFYDDELREQVTHVIFTLNVIPSNKISVAESVKYRCLNFVIKVNPYIEKT